MQALVLGGQADFMEAVRDQHLQEIQDHMTKLADFLSARDRRGTGSLMIMDLREALLRVDPKMSQPVLQRVRCAVPTRKALRVRSQQQQGGHVCACVPSLHHQCLAQGVASRNAKERLRWDQWVDYDSFLKVVCFKRCA